MNQERKGNQQQKTRSTTRTAVKIVLVVFFILFVLLIVVLWAGPLFLPQSMIEAAIAEQTEQELGRPAKIGNFKMKLIGGVNVIVDDLVVEDKEEYGDKPLLKVDKVTLNADLIPLLRNRLIINSMRVENPQVSVVRNKDGRLNITDLPQKPGAAPQQQPEGELQQVEQLPYVRITNTTLTNGSVTFTNLQTDETTTLTDVQGKLDLVADPDNKTADINTASFSFNGFQLTAKGNIQGNGENPEVKDVTLDSQADLTRIGKLLAPILPVTIAGNATYNCTAQGPFSAVKTTSKAVLSDFRATGEALRKPLAIPLLTSNQTSVLDLNTMSASQIDSTIESDALGLFAQVQGAIGDLQQTSGIDLKANARADLEKLADLATAFTQQPYDVQGKFDAQSSIIGDPAKKLTASGNISLNNLQINTAKMQQPYAEKQISLVYDLSVADQNSVNVQQFDLESSLLRAHAKGKWSPEAADLTATADADLDAVNAALTGIGALPEDTRFAGKLNAALNSSTLKEGIETKLNATITGFLLATPQFDEPYKEQKITLEASSLVDFLQGQLNNVKRSHLALDSRLAKVAGNLQAKNLTGEQPSLLVEANLDSQLKQVAQTLVDLGLLAPEYRAGGGVHTRIFLGTPDMVQPQNEQASAEAPEEAKPQQKPEDYIAHGTITGNDLFFNRITIQKTDTDFQYRGGSLTLASRSTVGDGSLVINGQSDLNKKPYAHQMQLKAERVLLTKELTDLFQRAIPIIPLPIGWLTGIFDAQAQLAATGGDAAAIFASLDGNGTVTMPEDVRVVIPALADLPGLRKYADMRFGTMKSDFTISDGLSKNKTIFSGSDLDMTLNGTTKLVEQKVKGVPQPGWPIDYRVSLEGEAVGRDLKRFLDKRGNLPVEIKGTLDTPKAKLVLSGLFGGLEDLFK